MENDDLIEYEEILDEDEVPSPKEKKQKGLGFFGFRGASAREMKPVEAQFPCQYVSLALSAENRSNFLQ